HEGSKRGGIPVMKLASELERIEPRVGASPWPDHEHVRGFAVMALPLSSGHVLGLRVWPESDFAPFVSVWHRTPEGHWSIFNDGPLLEATCSRYWGPVLRESRLARIHLSWTGPNELRVQMEDPHLVWTMSMAAPPFLRVMNAVSGSLPLWSWKPAPLLWMRQWMARRLLGMGDIRLSFEMPSGQDTTIMPERIFFIEASKPVLDGRDLREPVRLAENPTIGGIPLPARPTFAIGQAHMRIEDHEEYRLTRENARSKARERGTIQAG
ncbi:MAG: hypothetical protein ACRDTR_24845, partial [Rubrobacter sp.]